MVNPQQCDGHPYIRATGIRVSDVLALFDAGLSAEEILEQFPDLEIDDLRAVLAYSSLNRFAGALQRDGEDPLEFQHRIRSEWD